MSPLALDETIFLWINNSWSVPVLDFIMSAASVAGNASGWICLGLLWIFLADRPNLKKRAIAFIITMALTGALLHAAKFVAQRERPLEHFKHRIIAGEVVVKTPFERLTGSNSLPSGHSQAAFTAATFLALYYRKWRMGLLGVAAVVAISRVYLGSHFPLDIVAGALMGIAAGFAAMKLDPNSPTFREPDEPDKTKV